MWGALGAGALGCRWHTGYWLACRAHVLATPSLQRFPLTSTTISTTVFPLTPTTIAISLLTTICNSPLHLHHHFHSNVSPQPHHHRNFSTHHHLQLAPSPPPSFPQQRFSTPPPPSQLHSSPQSTTRPLTSTIIHKPARSSSCSALCLSRSYRGSMYFLVCWNCSVVVCPIPLCFIAAGRLHKAGA